jgi:squalene-hopene/tetraprenyl-beta-curcumene cyclase
MRISSLLVVVVIVGWSVGASPLRAAAADKKPKTFGPDPATYRKTVDGAIRFLATQQTDSGAVSPQIGIGPTALATLGLLRSGRSVTDPQVAKALKYLEQYTQESGGIHIPGGRITIYETCVALVCFHEAKERAKNDKKLAKHFDEIIKKAEAFIRREQWTEERAKQESDTYYGGAGYGGRSRPDLSNTSFLIDALKSCGAAADDPAIQKALVFVSRCQNLESEHNSTPFAAKVNDGGFYYTPVLSRQGGESQTPEGGLPSYGSMSYAGFKSMVFAGLKEDDPRVKAVREWIRKNYTVERNPGKGNAGLFYYYHTFAKALDASGLDLIEDAKGVKHDWRRELAEELAKRQRKNGSWVNTNRHWMEGDPNLATAFALLSLTYCQPKTSK